MKAQNIHFQFGMNRKKGLPRKRQHKCRNKVQERTDPLSSTVTMTTNGQTSLKKVPLKPPKSGARDQLNCFHSHKEWSLAQNVTSNTTMTSGTDTHSQSGITLALTRIGSGGLISFTRTATAGTSKFLKSFLQPFTKLSDEKRTANHQEESCCRDDLATKQG